MKTTKTGCQCPWTYCFLVCFLQMEYYLRYKRSVFSPFRWVRDTVFSVYFVCFQAVLCRQLPGCDRYTAVPLTKDHSPTLYEERIRIQRAGGQVRSDQYRKLQTDDNIIKKYISLKTRIKMVMWIYSLPVNRESSISCYKVRVASLKGLR